MLQHLDLAKQRCVDLRAAAERGRLVREIRHGRQHRVDGLWIFAAVRDLGRRLWNRTLAHSPKRDPKVGEAAVLGPLSNAVETGEPRLSIHAGVAARPEGPGLAPEVLGGGQTGCRRIGASDRRSQLRMISNSSGRRATDGRPAQVMAG